MPSITIDNIEYSLPPVVYDILMATADERDGYRDQVAELDAILRRSKAVSEVMARVEALERDTHAINLVIANLTSTPRTHHGA